MEAKVTVFDGAVKINLLVDEIPKENVHYTCIACISTDSVTRMEKNYLQLYLEECKYKMKKTKISKFIEAELESGSELEPESKSNSDTKSNSDSK